MSVQRLAENKGVSLVRTTEGGAKYVEAPQQEAVEEDAYNNSIGTILDRDFFPELPKLRAYNEWLEARQHGDFEKMAQIRANWRQSGTWEFERLAAFPILLDPFLNSILTCYPPQSEQSKRSFSSMDTPDVVSRGMAGDTPLFTAKRRKLTDDTDSAPHQLEENQLTKDAKVMSLDAFLTKYSSEDDANFSKLLDRQLATARRAYKQAFEYAMEEREKLVAQGKLIGWKGKKHDSSLAGMFSYPAGIDRSFSVDDFKAGEKAVVIENTRFPEGGPSWKREDDALRNASASASTGASSSLPAPSSALDAEPGRDLELELYARILRDRRAAEDGSGLFENADEEGPAIAGYRRISTPSANPNNVNQSPVVTWGEFGDADFSRSAKASSSAATSDINSGFSVPSISQRTKIANKIGKKRAPTPKSTPGVLPAHLKTPLFQMTPDLQLRSTYSTPKVSHGRTPSRLQSGTTTPSRTPQPK